MADVKIKRKQTVKPAEDTWQGVVTLSELDQVAGAAYVPTVYFYSKPGGTGGGTSIAETLKEALSRALVAYYPLAGRLNKVEESGRLELHCNAEGAELIEAESSSRLEDFGDFSVTQKFQHLIPFVDPSKPLCQQPLYLAQITHLSCGGVCLGMMISHAVADGSGLLYFINDWARLARGEPLEGLPCHDRTVLRAGEPPKDTHRFEDTMSQLSSLLVSQQSISEEPKETDMAMLPLSKAQVDKLKKAANEQIEFGRRPYSRYEVLAAHIWRCSCKVRGHDSNEERALGIGIDARYRLSNFPKKYFGNSAFVVGARAVAGELTSSSTPLSSTCGKIRETIEGVTEEGIWSNIEFLKGLDDISVCQKLRGLRPNADHEAVGYVNPNPGVISWLSIPVCGLDFGWGKEAHMSPGTHYFDGVSILLPGRHEPGSVIVYMSLQVDHLHHFKKHFYDDII
ncbi:hypothetical protein V2J09_015478 [Rumex salicifolius]